MATWKKIIVSGSVAELAAVSASVGVLVGTNQQIQSTQADTRLTGSFTGSFKGDGAGLTGVTATPTFPSTALTDITDSTNTKFFINDDAGNATSGNKQITWANLLTDIAGTNLSASSDSVSINPTLTGLTSVSATSFSGSFSGSFQGDGSALTGIAATLSISGSTGGGTVDLKTQTLSVVGTANEIETSATGQTITVGLPNDVTLTGDLTVGGNDIKMSGGTTALTFSGAGDVAVAGDLKVTGNDIKSSTGTTAITLNSADATVSGSLTVSGNLTVNGTNTVLNTTTVTVEDKWAIFASGSNDSTDGGIVVQQGDVNGFAFGVDASRARWALQKNFDGTSDSPTSMIPDSYMVSAEKSNSSPSADPTYGGSATGYGNIHINEITGEIWIYS